MKEEDHIRNLIRIKRARAWLAALQGRMADAKRHHEAADALLAAWDQCEHWPECIDPNSQSNE